LRTDEPTRVVQNIQAEAAYARSVTVAEIASSSDEHPILSHPHRDARYGAWTHAERIAHHARQMLATEEPAEVDAPAWAVGDRLLLLDGCHRACELYRLGDRKDWRFGLEITDPPHCDPQAQVVARS
jgi:hypothetical protein